MLSKRGGGGFHCLPHGLFRSHMRSPWLCFVLRLGRNLLLELLGRRKVNNLGLLGNERF